MKSRRILILGIVVLLVAGGLAFFHFRKNASATTATQYKTPDEAKSIYVRFEMEAYDQITANYWQKVKDADLAALFQLSLQKADASTTIQLPTQDRAGVAAMLSAVFSSATSTDAQRQLAVNTLTVALYNLAPQGRDQLLSQAQQTQLKNEVNNVNPSADLYNNLGVAKDATPAQIQTAYQEKVSAATTTAQKQAVAYAHTVLSNTNDKARYDQAQVQPTVFSHVFGHTLYLYFSQMAPTTVQEFAEVVDAASTTPGLSSMVIDLRGNIGGALDSAQYFLGLFQGQNQYAFDLFHQGDYEVQRTVTSKFTELNRYTDVALLTDNMTQSTAEVITAAFKRFHLGRVVGGTTRGWGSVEGAYPLATVIDPNTTYALLLVNSLTLRDDNVPVESKGVDPDVNISDKQWQQELGTYVTSSSLVSTIEQTVTQPPLK